MDRTVNREQRTENDSNLSEVVAGSAGAVAGGVVTSGAAISVAGAGGVSGYVAGTGILIAQLGCEAWAVTGLAAVAAGPVLGGLVGYGIYRGVKAAIRG